MVKEFSVMNFSKKLPVVSRRLTQNLLCSLQLNLIKLSSIILKALGSSWSLSYGSWGLQLPVQSVNITTAKVVSSYPAHAEAYSIQHYVIKFVSDL